MAKKLTLAQARQSRGYTQDMLAHSIGRQTGTVANWERGVNLPSIVDAQRACSVLRLSTDDIDWISAYSARHG